MLKRLLVLLGVVLSGFFLSTPAFAECGGSQQCIAVSIDPSIAPAHGTPLESAPLNFGSQTAGTTSAARTIFVGAVTGPAGTRATLNAIILTGANATEFAISGGTCTTGAPSLLADGPTCTVTVTFSPQTQGAKTATVSISTTAITRTVPLLGTAGRADPSTDANVIGLIGAQAQTARRFSRAQISNYHQRMESLHRAPGARVGATASGAGRGQLASSAPDADRGLGMLASAATRGSIQLAASSDRADGSPGLDHGVGLWAAGTLQFGTRDQTSDTRSRRFSTDGLSVGADRRFSDRLALGIGLGYARDRTDIGVEGTISRARGSSIALYGSFQPTRNTYIDGLIGYGVLDFDTVRFVPSVSDFARGSRDGSQLFGSIAAGYEHHGEGLLLSPYGRLDFARDRLKQYTESGAGVNALTYFEQKLPTLALSLGLRAESAHETSFGWALPRLRVELRHDFERNREATFVFADTPAGPGFSVTPAGVKRNSLLVGFGSDFLFSGGLKLGVDYQFERTGGPDRNQAIRFWLAKELDSKGLPESLVSVRMFDDPVRVEAGITFDDNVNRARDEADRFSDDIYSVNVAKGMIFPLTSNSRVVASGFLNGEKLRRIVGLERVSVGVQGEFQYRASGEFGAPTFGVFGRAVFDEYHSDLRSGYRYSLGVNLRKALTDRIDLFAALAGNSRHAESAVFDGREYAARFNLDYSLGRQGVAYLGGEYRRGDTVSIGRSSLDISTIAKAFVQDDVFLGRGFVSYRIEAKTVLWTLGYNRPLGARDSIDFSLRHIYATPTDAAASSSRYVVNQYSLVYLMRF
jgi:outer membrane autotransporter protein